jgi:hypothetical protein
MSICQWVYCCAVITLRSDTKQIRALQSKIINNIRISGVHSIEFLFHR